jgi:hypothetical protein
VLVADRAAGYAGGMERQELKAKLAQLHTELSQTSTVDPGSLERLQQLTADLDRLLDKDSDEEADGDVDSDGAASGLKDLLLKFEAEHPELSLTVGKVADALAAIGI